MLKYGVCLDGGGACPPGDVGGTGGYAECLIALADPLHEEHDNYLVWVGYEFDLRSSTWPQPTPRSNACADQVLALRAQTKGLGSGVSDVTEISCDQPWRLPGGVRG